MSLFAVVAVQKNVRDLAAYRTVHPEPVATERSSFASPQG
jgi:hypothetical protein